METLPWALRLELSFGEAPRCALFALTAGGEEHAVAAWAPGRLADAADAEAEWIAVAFSPSRRRAAVGVAHDVWTIELEHGTIVGHATGGERDAVLMWDGEELASCRRPESGGELRAHFADGVVVAVSGPVEDDGGEASSNGGASHLYFAHGTSPQDRRAAVTAARQEAKLRSRTDVHTRLVVSFGDRHIAVHDEISTPDVGLTQVQWPPLVGSRGVLLRRSEITWVPDFSPDTSTVAITSQEVRHPWLVTQDGTVTTLPFEFGNRPLATLPDGRFLLPCFGPMWWDGADEALTALSDDGTTEPLRLDGELLTPSAIVSAFDPTLVVPRKDDYDHEDAWWIATARVDGDTLAVALERGGAVGGLWLVAAIPLAGTVCGPPRLAASGRPGNTTAVRVAV